MRKPRGVPFIRRAGGIAAGVFMIGVSIARCGESGHVVESSWSSVPEGPLGQKIESFLERYGTWDNVRVFKSAVLPSTLIPEALRAAPGCRVYFEESGSIHSGLVRKVAVVKNQDSSQLYLAPVLSGRGGKYLDGGPAVISPGGRRLKVWLVSTTRMNHSQARQLVGALPEFVTRPGREEEAEYIRRIAATNSTVFDSSGKAEADRVFPLADGILAEGNGRMAAGNFWAFDRGTRGGFWCAAVDDRVVALRLGVHCSALWLVAVDQVVHAVLLCCEPETDGCSESVLKLESASH